MWQEAALASVYQQSDSEKCQVIMATLYTRIIIIGHYYQLIARQLVKEPVIVKHG